MVGQIVYPFLQKDTSTQTGIANSHSILSKTPKAIYKTIDTGFCIFLVNSKFEKIIFTNKKIVFSIDFFRCLVYHRFL